MGAPPARPTSLSRKISYNTTTSHDKNNIASTTPWTDEQETRLLYCQRELRGAQKRWSESQELWIEEYNTLTSFRNQVEHLTELKTARLKAHKKALKQALASPTKKKKRKPPFTLASRRSSKTTTGANTPARAGLSRVNSGINAFIASGLPRRSTDPQLGGGSSSTPAWGRLSRRSSAGVSGNEAYDDEDEDDDGSEDDVDDDDDDDESDDDEDEDTLGNLAQAHGKTPELAPSRRSSLSNTLRRLSIHRRTSGSDARGPA